MACPGLVFLDWVTAQGLNRTNPLSELSGTEVAIDGDDYVDRILTDTSTREPLIPALGGFPIALTKHVNAHLAKFDELKITPRFLFSGLDTVVKDNAAVSRSARKVSESLDQAWSQYSLSRADAAVEEFGKSCTHKSHNVRRWLIQYLVRKGYHASVAPYSASAQAVYWKYTLKSFANALAGTLDLFLFGAEKVILAFDWETSNFTWTTADMIRSKLGFNQDQLIDLCLLSGLTLLAPPPEVEDSSNPIDTAKLIMARAGNDGYAAIMQFKNDSYAALFRKTKTAVKHVPVIKKGGQLEPLHIEAAYGNLHDAIGRRLPEEVIYYCTRGFVNPRLLNTRTQMEMYEPAPLDGGRSQTYQSLVQQKLIPLRQQAQAVLSQRLHRYYHAQDIRVVCWFDESNPVPLGVPELISSLSKAAEKWHVPSSVLGSMPGFDAEELKASPLNFAITALTHDEISAKTITPRNNEPATLNTAEEFLANSMWRFLQARSYIDEQHKLTTWGRALNAALEKAHKNGYFDAATDVAEAEEALFLALELVRLDALDGSAMFTVPAYSGAPLRGNDTDKTNTNLISRVACLGSFQHKELGFTGPLSRHLLAYQQITATVRYCLRDLLELYSVDMLVSAAFRRDIGPIQWSKYGSTLPLLKEPDLGLALVVKSYLDELSNDPSRRADISRWFPQAVDVHADLEMAWKLWDAVNTGVQAADALSAELRTAFSTADTWLHTKLAAVAPSMPNGTAETDA